MDKKSRALQSKTAANVKLTKKNLKFIELIIKDVKTHDAYKLAGYLGGRDNAWQLKCKLKPFIERYYELEGVSREGYKSRMLKLLSLPCVDRQGHVLTQLSFSQYKEVLDMLRNELDNAEAKHRTPPNITAFVIKTFAASQREKGTGGDQVVDIAPLSVSNGPQPVNGG